LDLDVIWDGEWGQLRMGVLDRADIAQGKGQFWGEFGASHCNQWGCVFDVFLKQKCIQVFDSCVKTL